MTDISNAPDASVPPRPAVDLPAIDPPPRQVDARNTAVAFALSNITDRSGRELLKTMQKQRRARVAEEIRVEVERTRTAEERALEQLAFARASNINAQERLRTRNSLMERVRTLADVIRRKRHELEAKKIADELERLEAERKATIERLGSDRTKEHEAELADWNSHAVERKENAERLASTRTQLAAAERNLRETAAQRMNRWMSRTAAGFLVWAGYTVIGATGIAVAALFDDGQKGGLLTDLGSSAVILMGDLRGGPMHPIVAAAVSLLVFLFSVVLLVIGIDGLMRWFDQKRWLNPPKSAPNQFQFPTKESLNRATFSKLLIAVPFIYISGVIIAFIAYGGKVASNTILVGKTSAVLNAIIGSALSLLAASVFVLYFANIFEPRAVSDGRYWRKRWEVGLVPPFMLVAVALIAIFGPKSHWAWAGVTAFMLLGTMALAYGLLYRGMYRELDSAARAVGDCERRIEETLKPPEKEDPDKAERHEIDRVLSDYRARRQYLLDLDRERRLRRTFLTSDENDPSMIAAYHIATSFLWRVWVRFRRIGPQPDFYRTTDYEAAPSETELRMGCEQQIRELDLELKIVEPEKAAAQLEKSEQEALLARQAHERAEQQQPLQLAAIDEREAIETLDFDQAFAVGLSTKAAYDKIVQRRDETIAKAQRPRMPRPPHSEVPSGH